MSDTTPALPVVDDVPFGHAPAFAAVLREHGLILTDSRELVALERVAMIDRVGAFPAGGLLAHRARTDAAARTIFTDWDDLEIGPERSRIRSIMAEALRAAGV